LGAQGRFVSVDLGESIALVGHTGSGKTTITNLLMRFYDVQRDALCWTALTCAIGTCTRSGQTSRSCCRTCFLFSGSIENNIRLGNEDIHRERVEWAAREVRADEFIQRIDGDYSSLVRERGAGLSVGKNN
jgi:ATP-binding cassette subfamily B protein